MTPIEKGTIKVRVTTTRNVIYGTLSKTENSRTLDLLNNKERFIALTDAVVYDREHSEKEEIKFVAINTNNIVSVEEMG